MPMTTADRTAPISPWQVAAGVLQGAFYLGYPVVIYLAHTRLPTRGVGGLLLALYALSLAVRLRGAAAELWPVLRQHAALALLIVVAIVLDDRRLLLLLPMLVSLYLLTTFALSLRNGPPMIERFARAVEDDLPPFTFPYCRRVTQIWCVFLAANTVAVAALALLAPLTWWALYTGAIFYVLLGALIGAEFCFRKWWFRYYGDGLVDRILARVLPAERTEAGRRSLAYVERRRALASAATKGSAGTRATC
jgi:uncharacterized membrane protein